MERRDDVNCSETRARLHELVDLELTEDARQRVRRHLDECSTCRKIHGEIVALKKLVHTKTRQAAAPASLGRVIREGLRSEAASRSRPLQLAAALAVAVGLGVAAMLFLDGPQRLAHAAMVKRCLTDFERVQLVEPPADGRPSGRTEILGEVRRRTGLELDCLPVLEGYLDCDTVSVDGVKGARLDYEVEDVGRLSVYVLPLAQLDCPDGLLSQMAGTGHCCQCVEIEGVSVFCRSTSRFVFNFVVARCPDEIKDFRPTLCWPGDSKER